MNFDGVAINIDVATDSLKSIREELESEGCVNLKLSPKAISEIGAIIRSYGKCLLFTIL